MWGDGEGEEGRDKSRKKKEGRREKKRVEECLWQT